MEELQENIQQARDFALKNNYDSSLVVISFLKCLSISLHVYFLTKSMFNKCLTGVHKNQGTTEVKCHLLSRSDNSHSTFGAGFYNFCIWSKYSMASQGKRVCIVFSLVPCFLRESILTNYKIRGNYFLSTFCIT